MAEAEVSATITKQLEIGREAKAKSLAEFAERTKGKPTPTQEENDEAAAGKHFFEHEADGADVEPVQKHLEGRPGGTYQTRQAQPRVSPVKPAT